MENENVKERTIGDNFIEVSIFHAFGDTYKEVVKRRREQLAKIYDKVPYGLSHSFWASHLPRYANFYKHEGVRKHTMQLGTENL